jgi:hypothetical protein
MRKLLPLLSLLLWTTLAIAQYNNPTTTPTQGFTSNNTQLASTGFVKQSILAATGTLPIAGVTGGVYNFNTIGSGANFATLTSGGAISQVLTIITGGTGYQVGDCLVMVGGNGDAILRVTSVSSGAVTGTSILYGGTGYSGSPQLAGTSLPPGSRFGIVSGALTSNATIIIPNGTYLQGSRRIIFANNTTGAFTVSVLLSNGAGSTTGTGVILPQGSNNSTSMEIFTDGVTDVWSAVGAFPAGVTCTGTPSSSFATSHGVVTHC